MIALTIDGGRYHHIARVHYLIHVMAEKSGDRLGLTVVLRSSTFETDVSALFESSFCQLWLKEHHLGRSNLRMQGGIWHSRHRTVRQDKTSLLIWPETTRNVAGPEQENAQDWTGGALGDQLNLQKREKR